MGTRLSPSIRVLLFDHDDTMVGTIKPKWAQHKYVAARYYGRELTDDEIRQHWGKPLGELMCTLYGTDDVQTALANNRAHHLDYPKVLFEATIPTLRHLRAAGIIVGIVTATLHESITHDHLQLGIPSELVDYIQAADDTAYHKPDPRVFEPTLTWLSGRGVSPSEVLYVGDSLHDWEAAVGAGFNFLGVETGLVTAERFKAVGATSIPSIGYLVNE